MGHRVNTIPRSQGSGQHASSPSCMIVRHLATGQGTPGGAIQDSYNVATERGYVEPDFRHRFVASWVYQLPFGRGKTFGGNWNRATDTILVDCP